MSIRLDVFPCEDIHSVSSIIRRILLSEVDLLLAVRSAT